MKKPTLRTIKLDEIKATFYVRCALNEGRVSQLIKLAQSGVVLPPITVWWNEPASRFELIDGRHRIEMATRLEWADIKAEVVDEPDLAGRISLAVAANADGPLTPSDEDYGRAIETLMDNGVTKKRILECLPLPKSYTIKIYYDTQQRRQKVALNKAVNGVAIHGMTVAQAATKFKVDEILLRQKISGPKEKRAKVVFTDFTGGFTTRFRSFSQGNQHAYRQAFTAYDDGHLTAADVRRLLKSVSRQFRACTSALDDWISRFEVKVHESENGDSEEITTQPSAVA